MEGPASNKHGHVSGMMHLLLDQGSESRDHLQQTLIQVYGNFNCIYKAAIALLENPGTKTQTYYQDRYIEFRKVAGFLITFCRCSLMRILKEDGTFNKSLVDLLANVESRFVDLLNEEFSISRLVHFVEMKDIMQRIGRAYRVMYAKEASYQLIYDEFILEFLDQLLEDLDDLCDKDEKARILKKKLIELRKYIDLNELGYSHRLKEFMVSIQIVAYQGACYSFFRRFQKILLSKDYKKIINRVEGDVRRRFLKCLFLRLDTMSGTGTPMSDEILKGYVKCIQENRIPKYTSEILHEGLSFLAQLLSSYTLEQLPSADQEKLSDIRMNFQVWVKSVRSFIYSCSKHQSKENIQIALSDLVEKMDRIKEELIETICCMILRRMGLKSLETDQVVFVILFLENFKEFMGSKSDLMMTWKDDFDLVNESIHLIRSLPQDIRYHYGNASNRLRNIEDFHDCTGGEQIKLLIQAFSCLRNYTGCAVDLQEFYMLAQTVTFKMACYSLLRRCGKFNWWKVYSEINQYLDSHMRVGILISMALSLSGCSSVPSTDDLLFGYVDCVKENLIELVKDEAFDSMKDQINSLHDGLSFLVKLLIIYQPNQEKLVKQNGVPFQAFLRSIGSLICSCFSIQMEGSRETEQSNVLKRQNLIRFQTFVRSVGSFICSCLSSRKKKEKMEREVEMLIKQLKLITGETTDIIPSAVLNRVEQESLRADQLGFLTDPLANSKDPMDGDYDVIMPSAHDIHIPLQKVIEDNELQHFVNQATDAGYAAESQLRVSDEFYQDLGPTVDVVGFKKELERMMELLTGNVKHLDVVSIIGMPGLGKTTLARKVYENTRSHFDVRAWCFVSQEYNRKELFLSILSCIIKVTDQTREKSEVDLSVMVHKELTGRRYLIVVDDVWEIDAFTHLKRYFPDNEKGSRIVLTSRDIFIGVHAKCHSDPIELGFLSETESWNLLNLKVYGEGQCPPDLCQVGREIARKCRGLPLVIVVVAGLLAKSQKRDTWEQVVAGNVSSFLTAHDSQTQGMHWMASLELSYEHLPHYLKPLFLYLGVFPEDKEIPVDKLIWLWIDEGLVFETETPSLEIQAEKYLMQLIDRNLVMVAKRRSDGRVKSCHVHDVLREMCLAKARKEDFMQQVRVYEELANPIINQKRLCMIQTKSNGDDPPPSSRSLIAYDCLTTLSITPRLQTLLFFNMNKSFPLSMEAANSVFPILKDLRVLHSESTIIDDVDVYNKIIGLVTLRYMSIRTSRNDIPQSISRLQDLDTLIIRGVKGEVVVPETIWEMVKLRHLHINPRAMLKEAPNKSSKLENLDTLSTASIIFEEEKELVRKVPNLHKLRCVFTERRNSTKDIYELPDLESLDNLKSLKMLCYGSVKFSGLLKLPSSLKKLSISLFRLQWSQISVFKDLQILKLCSGAVQGEFWDTGKNTGFPNLKFLKLEKLKIKNWNATEEDFPRLEKLVLERCKQLKEIPSDLGYICTLERIEVLWCHPDAANAAKGIDEEQKEAGNYSLQVHIYPPPLDSQATSS